MYIVAVTPDIVIPTDGFTLTVNETEVAIFECTATGIPPPTISWYRNGTELSENLDPRITLTIHSEPLLVSGGVYRVSRNLLLFDVADNDSDIYTCNTTNAVGTNERKFELMTQGSHKYDLYNINL